MHHRSHDQPGGVSASKECLPPGVGGSASRGVCIRGRSACRGGADRVLPRGGVYLQGDLHLGGLSPGLGVCPTGTRKAGSTHPTGMLSCLFLQIIVMV